MEETHRRPRVKIPSYERERERERERDMYESNAWAQQEQSYTHATQETTQVKDDVEGYEELAALNLPKPRVHIPPATPLPYTSQQTRNQKARAITDPPRGSAAPKPLFAGRKVSIAELRHKFSKDSSSTNKKVGNMEQPPLPTTLDKAGRVLGAHPNKNNGRTPPASAPASSNTPEPYRASTDNDYPSRHGSPQRQIRSTPVPGPPTLRFFNENPGSRPSPASQRTYETASNEYNTPISGADAMILGDGKLSPTKNGAYGRMGNVEMQQHPARVSSMVGVVENVQHGVEGDVGGSNYQDETRSQDHQPHQGFERYSQQYDQPQLSANLLSPAVYSPSVYNNDTGAWEALQHQYPTTLPPFSPHPGTHHPTLPHLQIHAQSRDPSTASTNTLPFLFRGQPEEITPTSTTPSTYSTHHNSFALPPPPHLPPPPVPVYGNFVPTPPHPSFRPSSLASNVFDEHMHAFTMEIHHHMETSSTRLLHTLETRTDRLGDEVVRGFEGLGDAQREANREVCRRVEDGWKVAKREIMGVKEEGKKRREEIMGVVMKGEDRVSEGVERVGKRLEEVLGLLKKVIERVDGVERKVGEGACRCSIDNVKSAGAGQVGKIVGKEKDTKGNQGLHRRAASSNTTTATGASFHTNPNPRTTNPNASRGSNTLTNPTTTSQPTEDNTTSTRRNLYPDTNRHKTPEPDLSQHPAFQHDIPRSSGGGQGQMTGGGVDFEGLGLGLGLGIGRGQQGYGVDERSVGAGQGVVFQAPSWSNGGWYRQAYGS